MNDDYQLGYDAGYADFVLMGNKPNTNGHSIQEYQRITKTYLDAIYALSPTEWQRGYGDGADKLAAERGFVGKELTDEDYEIIGEFM